MPDDTESFETGFGDWANVGGDDFDWTRLSGSTPSSGTGPSSAYDGSYYIYTESSSPNYPSKVAIIEYTNLGGYGGTINFYYHMYGSAMGTLKLQAWYNSQWNDLWTKSGDQGNSWKNDGDITIPNGTTKLRFHMTTGSSYTSDAALDLIVIDENEITPKSVPDVGSGVDEVSMKRPLTITDKKEQISNF